MKIKNRSFAIRPIVIATAGLCILSLPSHGLQAKSQQAKSQQNKYEDLIELSYSGEFVSGTGDIVKGGFTVVTVQADKARTKVAVSLAVTQQEKRTYSDFRLLAVDKAGKRYPAKEPSSAGAGGRGVFIITMVSEFGLKSDMIAELVVQQTVKP